MVLFVIIAAFVAVVSAMQVLVLTSIGTTSRAYDSYRQGTAEMTRFQRAVAEALLDEEQVTVSKPTQTLSEALSARLAVLTVSGATVTTTVVPTGVPEITTFPNSLGQPDTLTTVPIDLQPFLTPELATLMGPHVAAYPELEFEFSSERSVLDTARTYRTQVKVRLIAAPLTRFPIAAYDLPAEIGMAVGQSTSAPVSLLPSGLVPARDPAFISDLQAQPGVLPYHYRRRAAIAAAYQYVFSQGYIDRVAEYAGITHYHCLDLGTNTASLAGMSQIGTTSTWDLGVAGAGSYNTITMTKDAAVVFTEQAGATLRLVDSIGSQNASALLVLVLGPSNTSLGNLTLDISSIARPVVIIGYNVRVTAPSGTMLDGALLLDPTSTMAPSGTMTVGHLSYWAGSTSIPENAVTSGTLPTAAEAIAPRVVFVATTAARL